MFWLEFITLSLILPVSCFFPGYWFVRRWRGYTAAETVCVSLALSLIILYLAAMTVFVTHLPWRCCWLFTAVWFIVAIFSLGDFGRLLAKSRGRCIMVAFGAVLLMGLFLQSTAMHYSGDRWAGDWIEHYERARFFLKHGPLSSTFSARYTLPARPPMQNLLAAYFLAHFSAGFDRFQVVFTFLNALAFFPCVLIAAHIRPFAARKTMLVAALLITSPMFVQNITFTWTKQLAAFFILCSVALYLRGWFSRRRGHLVLAAASLAAGTLVHYSTGPFAVFIGIHFIIVCIRRKDPRTLLTCVAVVLLLLSTWFAWSSHAFGVRQTFMANSSISDRETLSTRQKLSTIGYNLWTTLVPHPLRISPDEFDSTYAQPNTFGYVRDYAFTLYQTNLPISMGVVGWLATLLLAVRVLRGASNRLRWFWIGLLLTAFVLGAAAEPVRDEYGSAHVCLQPLTLLARACLAAGLVHLSRRMRFFLVWSLVVDVLLGIVLQFRMQMLVFKSGYFDSTQSLFRTRGMLSIQAVLNSVGRFNFGYAFLGDHLGAFRILTFAFGIGMGGLAIAYIAYRCFRREMSQRELRRLIATLMVVFALGAFLCCCDQLAGFTPMPTP
jgi:hypothetical protein